MYRNAARLGISRTAVAVTFGQGWFLRVGRVVAMIAAGGLIVTGCGGDGSNRYTATGQAIAAEMAAAGDPVATAPTSEVATAKEPATSATESNVYTPTPAPLATGTAVSSDISAAAPRDSSSRVRATPTAVLATEVALDDDGSSEGGVVGGSAPPTPPKGGLPDDEHVAEEDPPIFDPDNLLAEYSLEFWLETPPNAQDEVVVDSFSVRECVMRGIVHNQSDRLFARNVVVTIESPDGEKSASWHWPLTMLPGERAPFEIEINWPRSDLYSGTDLSSHIVEVNNPWHAIQPVITADLSEDVDISRSFIINHDQTEPLDLYQTGPNAHKFFVHDERIYGFEDWDEFDLHYSRENSFYVRDNLRSRFPADLVIDNDLNPIASRLTLYDYSDIYYTPETLFPNHYNHETDGIVDNVKAYQAVFIGNKILDIRELILHTIMEEINDDRQVTNRKVTPVSQFTNYEIDSDSYAYFLWTVPTEFGMQENTVPRIETGQNYTRPNSRFWIGTASGVNPFESKSIVDNYEEVRAERDQSKGSCDHEGGLVWQEFEIRSNSGIAGEVHTIPLGYRGILGDFEPLSDSIDIVVVKAESVAVDGGTIRGLLHNPSESLFARDVAINAVSTDNSVASESWKWPLTIQPGEYAPFEIENWAGPSELDEIEFNISAHFSDKVDISRSFLIRSHTHGIVYGEGMEELYAQEKHQNDRPGWFKDDRIFWGFANFLLEEEFDHIYPGILHLESTSDADVFAYSDIYAGLEHPDSHPSLSEHIKNQSVEKLNAYAALFDSEMTVTKILKLKPFIVIHDSTNERDNRILLVDSIPTPSYWAPHAVRLLLTIPRGSQEEAELYRFRQVWIGGVS